MKNILLIDYTRSFVDARPAHMARSSKEAVNLLAKHEKEIQSIWVDPNLGAGDNIKFVLDYLILRAKIGQKYPVKVINIHCLDEGGWQLLSTKLGNAGYVVNRTSVRDTLA